MKIGLMWEKKDCGFYANSNFDSLYRYVGHNNGNLAFVYAISKQFIGEYEFIPWHTKPEDINGKFDAIIFPSANQLGKHTDLGGLAKNIAKIECPIIVIGLGAQAKSFEQDIEITDGTAAWLHELLENGQKHGITNIYTRGPFTTKQIKKLTGVDVKTGGCPTHFISQNTKLGSAIQENWASNAYPRVVTVAGGHQSWVNVRTIEHQLIALMMDPLYPGQYIAQSMGDMIKMTRGLFDDIDPKVIDQIRKHTVPQYSLDEFKIWARRFARSFYDVPAWADALRSSDLVIGPRYHGCAIALQAERMACVVTIDSRTEEMCMETGVPYIKAVDLTKPITRDTLKNELIQFDPLKYDELRRDKCKNYIDFCTKAGLKTALYLDEIAFS